MNKLTRSAMFGLAVGVVTVVGGILLVVLIGLLAWLRGTAFRWEPGYLIRGITILAAFFAGSAIVGAVCRWWVLTKMEGEIPRKLWTGLWILFAWCLAFACIYIPHTMRHTPEGELNSPVGFLLFALAPVVGGFWASLYLMANYCREQYEVAMGEERKRVAPEALPKASQEQEAAVLASDASARTRYCVNTYSAWRQTPLANDPQRIRRMARKLDLNAFVDRLSADALSEEGLDQFFREYPPRDGEFLILWPRDLSAFSPYVSEKDQDPFLMTNLRLVVFDAMKLTYVLDIEQVDRFQKKGAKGKTVEITLAQGETIMVHNALTGEAIPKIIDELRQRSANS